MNGLTDLWQWNMQVALVLNQTAMSSACRANTLERCAVMRSEVVLPQVTTSFLSFPLLFWASCWFEFPLVGGEPVCYIHLILHDMEKVSWCAIFVSFKLHGGPLPSLRPVPCCFWDVTKPVTYIHLLEISAFVLSFSHNMTSFICQPFPAQDYVIGCGHGMTALRHNSWDFIRPVWWLQVVNINVVCLLYHSFSETQLHICKHSGSCSRCIAAKSYAIKTIMSFYPHLCWKEFNLCTGYLKVGFLLKQ